MQRYGYGEDGLTLSALTRRQAEILSALDDGCRGECIVFYRPSFGRRGGSHRAEFGEFDGILISDNTIHVIESKWDRCVELPTRSEDEETLLVDGELELPHSQFLRHAIFESYITLWRAHPHNNWKTFCDAANPEFSKRFNGKPMAPEGSLLARNLAFVLEAMPEFPVKHVAIYFHRDNAARPSAVARSASRFGVVFHLVPLSYSVLRPSAFYPLDT